MTAAVRRTFASLYVSNYRRYFAGQVVSVSGMWVQNVAVMWLMVQLTGDGLAVGLTVALQFVPLMLLGAWGGLLADRFDKRRLLIGTQLGLMVPAVVLAVATFADVVTPLLVYAMADHPTGGFTLILVVVAAVLLLLVELLSRPAPTPPSS